MSNLSRGGFRWKYNKIAPNTVSEPLLIIPVASAYGTVLYRGDPVKLAGTGTVVAAAAGDRVYGIFDGAERYYDGVQIRKGTSLPVSTYGSNLTRQSLARVIPVDGQVFEVQADEAATATTQAGYQAFLGENCEWIAGTATGDESGAQLDISTHNTTNTLSVRIVDIPNQDNQDFASTAVKLHVIFNLTQDVAAGTTTGV